MTAQQRTSAHYLKVAQKLKTEAGAKVQATGGTSQSRTEQHYLALARKMKTA
jgi:transcriptional antiterminator Rof (Rho-off)